MSLLRRSSVIIDMDLPSFPPTRASTPPLALSTVSEAPVNGAVNGDASEGEPVDQRGRTAKQDQEEPTSPVIEDAKARKAALGSLMKSAKKDVVVPEFDMSSFGF